jgi:uncharacterized membrane protein YoaK (UPF0700 family)
MAEPITAHSESLNGAAIMLIALGGMLVLLLLFGVILANSGTANCRNSNAPQTSITGNVRKAGQDYYLVGDSGWHLLQSRCSGKVRQACLDASNHAEVWLEAHLGESVSARACAHGIVDYTVAERSFRH